MDPDPDTFFTLLRSMVKFFC